jgi:hypothetical protein
LAPLLPMRRLSMRLERLRRLGLVRQLGMFEHPSSFRLPAERCAQKRSA